MILYTLCKFKGSFVNPVKPGNKEMGKLLQNERGLIEENIRELYGSKSVEFAVLDLGKLANMVKMSVPSQSQILVIDRCLFYTLKKIGANPILLDIGRTLDVERGKNELKERILPKPEISNMYMSLEQLCSTEQIKNSKNIVIVDIGTFDGETLLKVQENIGQPISVMLGMGLTQGLQNLKQSGIAFEVMEKEYTFDEWVEVRDISMIGRYGMFKQNKFLLPYLYYPRAASSNPVGMSGLLEKSSKIRETFSKLSKIYCFPYDIEKKELITRKIAFVDFDGTFFPNTKKFDVFSELLCDKLKTLGIKDSYDAVKKGLFSSRKEYFDEVWGEVIRSVKGQQCLGEYVKQNMEQAKENLRLIEEMRRRGWMPIILTDGPSVYIRWMFDKLEKEIGKIQYPFYLTITTDNTSVFTEKNKMKNDDLYALLNLIYYAGWDGELQVVLFDDNDTTEFRLDGQKIKQNKKTDCRMLSERIIQYIDR